MFYLNYLKLCNKRGISPSAAAEEMGFHRSDVTRWSKGSQPRQATLQKIADYFGVLISELIESEKKEKPPDIGELSEIRKEAWDMIQRMDDDTLRKFIRMAKAALEE